MILFISNYLVAWIGTLFSIEIIINSVDDIICYRTHTHAHIGWEKRKPVWIKMENMSRFVLLHHTSVIKRFASENCRRTEHHHFSLMVNASVRQTKCSFDTIEHIQLMKPQWQPICCQVSLSLFNSNTFRIHKNKQKKRNEKKRKWLRMWFEHSHWRHFKTFYLIRWWYC